MQLMRLQLELPSSVLAAAAIAGVLDDRRLRRRQAEAPRPAPAAAPASAAASAVRPPINGLESLDGQPDDRVGHPDGGRAGTLTRRARSSPPPASSTACPTDVTQMVTWQVDLKGVTSRQRPRHRDRARHLHDHRQERQLPGVGDADRDVLGRDLRPELQPDEQQQDRARRDARRARRTCMYPLDKRCSRAT